MVPVRLLGGTGYVRAGALRAALVGVDDETLVVMSKDAEGNSFSPLAEVEPAMQYIAETTWMGDVYDPDGEDADEYDGGERCLVLWPTN